MNIPTLTDDDLIADLRDHRVEGPIDADFLAQYRLDREYIDALIGDDRKIGRIKRSAQRVGLMPVADAGDQRLVDAWQRFSAARAAIEATGPDASAEVDAPLEAIVDATDDIICLSIPAGLEGVRVKLLRSLVTGIYTGALGRWAEPLVYSGDFVTLFSRAEELDYEWRLLVDALAGLDRLSSDPHMGWLAERDAIWSEYNGYTDDDEARDEPLVAAGRALEQRIIDTPATTRDGILAKALLIVGAAAIPGDDPDPIRVFNEAKAMGLMEWMA